jgi:hypothetical protein
VSQVKKDAIIEGKKQKLIQAEMKECTFQPNTYKKKKSPVLSHIVT